MFSLYTFQKCKRVLKQSALLYKRKKEKLNESEKVMYENMMHQLCEAIFSKRKEEAVRLSQQLEEFNKKRFKKTSLDQGRELIFAIIFALVIAFLIREFWFELYEVPTGSMRPTIEEQDRLIVSKTTFGLHIPFQNKLFLHRDDYIKRNGIIVFTVEDMDVADADTTYFYLFPGKKRFIKRCLGRPGDILYFYGGRIYGIDKDKNPITELYDEENLKKIGIETIEHIPYISFDGKTVSKSKLSTGIFSSSQLLQMNLPLGQLSLKKEGGIEGLFYNGKSWEKDDPFKQGSLPSSYGDMWGIRNYAMARLLNKKQLQAFYSDAKVEDGLLYLELHHTPNLTFPEPEIRQDDTGNLTPQITPFTTLIPLQEKHIEAIKNALFTSRFYVQDGRSYRYNEFKMRPQRQEYDPLFPQVPDGLYEFEKGVAYEILFSGIRKKLPLDHPLYNSQPSHIQKLFNIGINFNILFEPIQPLQPYLPQRFAYFRQGDLYLMGKPILKKEDATLVTYIERELEKEKTSKYVPFVDRGPPLKEGVIDKEFIETFGLKVEGALALGDNYSMSADSRDFGFVPVHNLRGSPVLIFWPFSSFGTLPQPSYPFFILPNIVIMLIILVVAAILIFVYYLRHKKLYYEKLIANAKV